MDKRYVRGVAIAKKFRDGTCQINCRDKIAYRLPYGSREFQEAQVQV